jgi:regulator of sigma E protease
MISIIIFILILGTLVLIHEFGHFIFAKKNGVLVEEFGFGFPPRIFGVKKGETLYSINLLPIGGFVKLYGEEYQELNQLRQSKNILPPKKRAFVFKKPFQKFLIIIGGVLMNVILAPGIYYFLLGTNQFQSEPLPLFNQFHFTFGKQQGQVIIAEVVKNSPASKVGITTEDAVVRFKVNSSNNWVTITSASQLISEIKNRAKQKVTIQLVNIRSGNQKTVMVIPYYNLQLKRAIIGANLIDAVIIKYDSITDKLLSGFLHSYNLIGYNISVFGDLISTSFKSRNIEPVSQTVSGPIGIFAVVNDLVQSSGRKLVVNLLNVVALLSLSLALINILPLPALDGGRLVFVIYEWITGKQVQAKVEKYINAIGFIFLISLAIVISINDILKFFVK